jgi:hypothetical protein
MEVGNVKMIYLNEWMINDKSILIIVYKIIFKKYLFVEL